MIEGDGREIEAFDRGEEATVKSFYEVRKFCSPAAQIRELFGSGFVAVDRDAGLNDPSEPGLGEMIGVEMRKADRGNILDAEVEILHAGCGGSRADAAVDEDRAGR